MSPQRVLVFAVAFLTFLPLPGVIIANYSNATNLRFADNPSFIGSSFDLSGAGRGAGRWATVIGPNYFLSANHFRPGIGSTINFAAGNSSTSPSFSYPVNGGFRIGKTDLWLGYTHEEFDPAIARYSYATQNANTLSELGLGDSTLYLNGRRSGGDSGSLGDSVLGTNQAEAFYKQGTGVIPAPGGVNVLFDAPSGFQNDMIILFQNQSGDDRSPLQHESLVQGGDSGGPLFAVTNESLIVLGVGSLLGTDFPANFIDTPGIANTADDPIEYRGASFYSSLGSYTSELEAAISQVPNPIPEPGTLLLAVILPLSWLVRRR